MAADAPAKETRARRRRSEDEMRAEIDVLLRIRALYEDVDPAEAQSKGAAAPNAIPGRRAMCWTQRWAQCPSPRRCVSKRTSAVTQSSPPERREEHFQTHHA